MNGDLKTGWGSRTSVENAHGMQEKGTATYVFVRLKLVHPQCSRQWISGTQIKWKISHEADLKR